MLQILLSCVLTLSQMFESTLFNATMHFLLAVASFPVSKVLQNTNLINHFECILIVNEHLICLVVH